MVPAGRGDRTPDVATEDNGIDGSLEDDPHDAARRYTIEPALRLPYDMRPQAATSADRNVPFSYVKRHAYPYKPSRHY